MRPRQSSRKYVDNNSKYIFMHDSGYNVIKISQIFVPMGPTSQATIGLNDAASYMQEAII